MEPCRELRRHVHSYVLLAPEGELKGYVPWRILPEGCAHLILHVYRNGRRPQFGFVGPRSVYADIDRSDRRYSLIVKFRPGGTAPFLGTPLNQFTDLTVPIEDLWNSEGAELRDELVARSQDSDLSGPWASLEAALLRRMHGVPTAHPIHPLAKTAVRNIEESGGRVQVRDLAQDLGVTERHLRSVLAREVGLGPKRLARITRVTRTLRMAEADPGLGWAPLAASAGYCDQPHLIEDFQTLLGESPETFLARPNRE